MAAAVSWYGPLIDLSAAASHVGGFVQLLAAVRRVLPHQEQNAATGRTYQRTIVEVGDDSRSSFCVSVWSSKQSSGIIAGDVLLMQNIKIVEFRSGLEGRASQISAVQVLFNSEDLTNPEGIVELITSCKVGDATKSKLRRVAEWTLRTKRALGVTHQQLQAISKNWKEAKEKESSDLLCISELFSQRKLCYMKVYACISKMVLVSSPTSHLGHLSVIDKHSLKEHNEIVRDFITAGCKLCGSPLYHKNLHGKNSSAIDCPNNPKYLHVPGQIYKPFMIYVYDQSGQVPLLVRNKAAEILFANIIADDVSECYKSHMLETSESGNLSAPGTIIDGVGSKEITKRRKTEHKPNFYQIWLVMIKCLLNQGSNSPFCFQILVNPEKNVEDGRFELVSLTMPIP
ncbi:hypothetical protein GQ55_7G162300 [Panicum hallii var. hallii]|uniref:Uncharacterized protein n=1 Tax=Panicum hallii var. hallii TaxID=1504633 RepID=A0A2T7CVN1_9POAL|nr:hypothetical protein GQ55_7G162300 [Panicum hallii var. hallii]